MRLAGQVSALWQLVGSAGAGRPWRVLPDGSGDLLLRLDPLGGGPPTVTLVGAMRSAQVVPLSGPQRLLGVRLRPGAMGSCLGIAARSVTDAELPLAELGAPWGTLAEQLAGAGHGHLGPLWEHLARVPSPPPEVMALLTAMGQSTAPSVARFAQGCGVGVRRLERLFAYHVGITPKEQLMQLRVRRLLAAAAGGAPDGWAALAVRHGFFDQAHLIHEVRRFTGLTPGAWLSQISKPAGAEGG